MSEAMVIHVIPLLEPSKRVIPGPPEGIPFEFEVDLSWLEAAAKSLPGVKVYFAVVDESQDRHQYRSPEPIGHVVSAYVAQAEHSDRLGGDAGPRPTLFAEVALQEGVEFALPDGTTVHFDGEWNHTSVATGGDPEIHQVILANRPDVADEDWISAVHYGFRDPGGRAHE